MDRLLVVRVLTNDVHRRPWRRHGLERWYWAVVAMIVFSVCVPPSAAGTEWSAVTESRMTYTDNVSQFAVSRRQRLSEDPSQPTVVPTEKRPDLVWGPSMEVVRSSRPSMGHTDISVRAQGYLYTANPIFNHGDYRLEVKQGLSSSDTVVRVRYRYLPNQFLGQNVERRTGSRLLEEERVTSHAGRMEIEQKLSERWSLTWIGRGGSRVYNDAFAQRNTIFWTMGPNVSFRLMKRVSAAVGYLFERGHADGAGDIRFNDDISYRQQVLSGSINAGLTEVVSLHLIYVYRRKDFTTELITASQFQRRDDTHQGSAELRYMLSPAAMLMCSLQRTQRGSTVAARGFQETQVAIGAQYRF